MADLLLAIGMGVVAGLVAAGAFLLGAWIGVEIGAWWDRQ
jgi:hypothetical protein